MRRRIGPHESGTGPAGRWRLRRLALTALRIALVWGALGALGYVGGWELHVKRAGSALVRAEQALTQPARGVVAPGTSGGTSRGCEVSSPRTGQLTGVLEIPALHLSAPVEEGTGDPVLNVAVGHDPSSVAPGAQGTSVLLAHDVSYFVHIGSLQPGDAVEYRTPCGTTHFTVSTSQVVAQGAPIPNSSGPALVLGTCYPSNALFFTDQRLLVWAEETGGTTTGGGGPDDGRSAPVPPVAPAAGGDAPTTAGSYSVPVPPALLAQGLTLGQNEVPMGTMTLVGDPATAWVQSPGPMALEAAALEAYFGGLHAMAETAWTWWSAIAEQGVAPPAALVHGGRVAGQDAPLDVEIVSAHGTPTGVVLTTTVSVTGGDAPGAYAETVSTAVEGATVRIGGWSLRPV